MDDGTFGNHNGGTGNCAGGCCRDVVNEDNHTGQPVILFGVRRGDGREKIARDESGQRGNNCFWQFCREAIDKSGGDDSRIRSNHGNSKHIEKRLFVQPVTRGRDATVQKPYGGLHAYFIFMAVNVGARRLDRVLALVDIDHFLELRRSRGKHGVEKTKLAAT